MQSRKVHSAYRGNQIVEESAASAGSVPCRAISKPLERPAPAPAQGDTQPPSRSTVPHTAIATPKERESGGATFGKKDAPPSRQRRREQESEALTDALDISVVSVVERIVAQDVRRDPRADIDAGEGRQGLDERQRGNVGTRDGDGAAAEAHGWGSHPVALALPALSSGAARDSRKEGERGNR